MPDSLLIPSCPEILIELNAAMKQQEPDIQIISSLVNADVGLYSSLLATVNSPALGLKQTVESVPQAITLLGHKRTFTLLQSVVLKNSMDQYDRLDRFWDTASEVAGLCMRLASQFSIINQDKAYSIGMLHDIGIPVMMANFPNYKNLLQEASQLSLRDFSSLENDHFQVDHFTLGYRLTKEWHLPTTVSKVILLQPLFEKAFDHSIKVHENLLSYLAILMLAKDISSEYRYFWRLTSADHFSDYLIPILEFLEIPKMEYLDIKEKMIEDIEANNE